MNYNRKIIYLASFLFSLSFALALYINSSFLEIYVGAKNVAFVYITASIVTITGLLQMPKLLTRVGNRRASLTLSLIIFVSLLLLSFGSSAYIILPAFIVFFAATNFLIMSLDIFIEDFSRATSIGKFRGFYLTVINSGLIVSQLISGRIIMKSSYEGIYLLSAFFMVLVSVIFILFLHNFKDPKYKKIPILRTLRIFRRNKNISKIYFINLILKFFYAWMVIYNPIYLHQYLGLSWGDIGFIFSIMLLPFVLLEFPLGKLSDKIGEKKMLSIGFLIIILATLSIPLVHTPTIWLLALILFLSRVGAATIEVMSETYFFKSVSEEDADAISFFRNTESLSYIIAPLCAIPVILFIPSFKYIFFVLGAVLLSGLFIALRLRDVK